MMTTKRALTIGLILAAGATAIMLRPAPRSRISASSEPDEVKATTDPFADMIEEGDGLLARWKAEAAEAARKGRTA